MIKILKNISEIKGVFIIKNIYIYIYIYSLNIVRTHMYKFLKHIYHRHMCET